MARGSGPEKSPDQGLRSIERTPFAVPGSNNRYFKAWNRINSDEGKITVIVHKSDGKIFSVDYLGNEGDFLRLTPNEAVEMLHGAERVSIIERVALDTGEAFTEGRVYKYFDPESSQATVELSNDNKVIHELTFASTPKDFEKITALEALLRLDAQASEGYFVQRMKNLPESLKPIWNNAQVAVRMFYGQLLGKTLRAHSSRKNDREVFLKFIAEQLHRLTGLLEVDLTRFESAQPEETLKHQALIDDVILHVRQQVSGLLSVAEADIYTDAFRREVGEIELMVEPEASQASPDPKNPRPLKEALQLRATGRQEKLAAWLPLVEEKGFVLIDEGVPVFNKTGKKEMWSLVSDREKLVATIIYNRDINEKVAIDYLESQEVLGALRDFLREVDAVIDGTSELKTRKVYIAKDKLVDVLVDKNKQANTLLNDKMHGASEEAKKSLSRQKTANTKKLEAVRGALGSYLAHLGISMSLKAEIQHARESLVPDVNIPPARVETKPTPVEEIYAFIKENSLLKDSAEIEDCINTFFLDCNQAMGDSTLDTEIKIRLLAEAHDRARSAMAELRSAHHDEIDQIDGTREDKNQKKSEFTKALSTLREKLDDYGLVLIELFLGNQEDQKAAFGRSLNRDSLGRERKPRKKTSDEHGHGETAQIIELDAELKEKVREIGADLDYLRSVLRQLNELWGRPNKTLTELNLFRVLLRNQKLATEQCEHDIQLINNEAVRLSMATQLKLIQGLESDQEEEDGQAGFFRVFADDQETREQFFPPFEKALDEYGAHVEFLYQELLRLEGNLNRDRQIQIEARFIRSFNLFEDFYKTIDIHPEAKDQWVYLAHTLKKLFDRYKQAEAISLAVDELPPALIELARREDDEAARLESEYVNEVNRKKFERFKQDYTKIKNQLVSWNDTFLRPEFSPYSGQRHPAEDHRDSYRREVQKLLDNLAEMFDLTRQLDPTTIERADVDIELGRCQRLINQITEYGVDLKTDYVHQDTRPIKVPVSLRSVMRISDAAKINYRIKEEISVEALEADLTGDIHRLEAFLERRGRAGKATNYEAVKDVFTDVLGKIIAAHGRIQEQEGSSEKFNALVERVRSLRTRLNAALPVELPEVPNELLSQHVEANSLAADEERTEILTYSEREDEGEDGGGETAYAILDIDQGAQRDSELDEEGEADNVASFPSNNQNVQSSPSRRGILRIAAAALATIGLGGLFPWSRYQDQPSKVKDASRNLSRSRPTRSRRSPEVPDSIELDPESTLLEEMRAQGATVTEADVDFEKFRQAGATVREGTESEPLKHEGITYILKRVILHDPRSYGFTSERMKKTLDDRATKLAIRLTKEAGLMDKWLTKKAADDQLMIFPLYTDRRWQIAAAIGDKLVLIDDLENLGYLEAAPRKN
jgi:hypothetical protein